MNHLIFWKDFRLFYGSHPRAVSAHSHPMIQFVVGVEAPFFSKNDDGGWKKKAGILIAPNRLHECDANKIAILSVEIDPESSLGEWITANQLQNHSIVDYPSKQLETIDFKEFKVFLKDKNWFKLRKLIEKTFGFRQRESSLQKDQRIQLVLDYISTHIDQTITSEELMAITQLSESRMIHLFKELMGLPIRNYILWSRLQKVMQAVMEEKSLTIAAHEAGFADQAHMTRTFKKMIGIPPSLIAKNSKFVQVSFP